MGTATGANIFWGRYVEFKTNFFFNDLLLFPYDLCHMSGASEIMLNVDTFFFFPPSPLGVLHTSVVLLTEMCERSPDMLAHFRKVSVN